jgi:plasmid stability protein
MRLPEIKHNPVSPQGGRGRRPSEDARFEYAVQIGHTHLDAKHQSLDRKLGNQQNRCMKTTLDLPDALVKQVNIRAVREGRKLNDAVADLLRKGLAVAAVTEPDAQAPVITKDKKTLLPLIVCKQAAAPEEEMTPERVADILLAQEVEWHHAASR